MSSSVISVMRKARNRAKSYAAPDWKPEKQGGARAGKNRFVMLKFKKCETAKNAIKQTPPYSDK
jgi:hypothetical protein